MDGIARNARMVVQDAGAEAECAIAEVVEHGGNINPGPLTDRMTAAINSPILIGTVAMPKADGGRLFLVLNVNPVVN